MPVEGRIIARPGEVKLIMREELAEGTYGETAFRVSLPFPPSGIVVEVGESQEQYFVDYRFEDLVKAAIALTEEDAEDGPEEGP